MVAFSKITLTATAVIGAIAAPTQHGPLVKFGELKSLPSLWSAQGQADKNAMITAQIGLKQNNIKALQDKLMDVSDPFSPNYGKWLSRDEIAKYTAPAEEHVKAVKSWLSDAGITGVSQPQNDWIEFTVPVHQMESLLGAKYEWFTHANSGLKVPRTTKFSVPRDLHSMIDVVTPTTAFYSSVGPREVNQGALGAAASSPLISPDKIRSLYNVDYNSTGSQLGATSGLIGVGASHSDFAAFGRNFVPGLKDFKDQSVNGGHNSGSSDLEGNLDTQYMGGVGYPNPSEYLSVAPTGSDAQHFNDALAAFGNYLNSASNPPSVASTSYGAEERTLDGSYLDRICNEYMKAGAAGITVTFSSGDNGVGGNGESYCFQGFYSLWPASCPYITSVGGTEFDSNGQEVVANFQQYASSIRSPGGGYSEHFTAPSYNRNVTAAYAKSLDSNTQRQFNANNRGFPDISLVSVQFQTYISGKINRILGTSASSPAVASLIGVLNDYRKSKGQPNLGFINPLLYSGKVDAAIRDVTSGSNFGCNRDGFPAKKGWDAASGLGSFDFGKLRSLI